MAAPQAPGRLELCEPGGAGCFWGLELAVTEPSQLRERARALPPAESKAMLEAVLPKLPPEERGRALGMLARLERGLGDRERAAEWLEQALQAHQL